MSLRTAASQRGSLLRVFLLKKITIRNESTHLE